MEIYIVFSDQNTNCEGINCPYNGRANVISIQIVMTMGYKKNDDH